MAIEWIVCSIVVCPNIHVWCGSSWNTWAILLFLPWTSNSRSRDYLNVLLGTVILYFLLMSRWHEIQESIPVIQTKMQKLCALLFSLARYTFPKLITTLHIEWCSVQIHIFFLRCMGKDEQNSNNLSLHWQWQSNFSRHTRHNRFLKTKYRWK